DTPLPTPRLADPSDGGAIADFEPPPPFAEPPEPTVAATPILGIEPSTTSDLGFPVATTPTTADGSITEFQILTPKKSESTSVTEEELGFVRVNVRHLNQLNDLLGELTIDRNGLTLYLKRLRSLVKRLSRQVRVLDKANTQLQSVYDQNMVNTFNGTEPGTLSPYPLAMAASLNGQGDPFAAEMNPSDPYALLRELALLPSELERQFDVLEMDRYTDLHHLFQTVMEGMVQIQEVAEDLGLNLDDSEQAARNLNKTARQLQVELTHARMRPLADVANRFPRALRELSLRHGKQARFELHGGSTLIDRTILDGLGEPLMHMVRNAFDHGLEDPETRRQRGKPETGTIAIYASHQGNRTLINISDDGRGIDLEKVRRRAIRMGLDEELLGTASDEEILSLIFEPGFSTAEQTTDLSGRGVGMDVVRDRLQQLHGDIKITTRAGHGTTFSLSLPLTLSITRVLLAESNGMLIAIPTDTINEMVVLEPDQIRQQQGQEVFDYDHKTAHLIRLSQWLTFHCPRSTPDELETPPSIKVPSVLIVKWGNQIIGIEVERSWREQEVTVRRVVGTISLPEGFSSCTILGDGRVVPLLNIAAMLHWVMSNQRVAIAPTSEQPRLLAGSGTATVPINQTQSPAAPPHLAPNQSSSPTVLPESWSPPRPHAPVPAPQPGSQTSPPAPRVQPSVPHQLNVMVVDDSFAVRRLLAMTLEKASYRVEQAKDGLDALEKLTNGPVMDAVICDVEMPRLDGYRLLAKLQADETLRDIPVMMLTSRSGEKHRKLAMGLGAKGYCTKPYNEQVLLQQLADITLQKPLSMTATKG
ncbi:MAG: response regulator, partial [Leptolyngbyaceae bacterium]|nr:response regulator [Leptolyngbyaceae bacterium]